MTTVTLQKTDQDGAPLAGAEFTLRRIQTEVMAGDGGYIFAAAHNIQPDVNPRSLTVMLNAARKYRRA